MFNTVGIRLRSEWLNHIRATWWLAGLFSDEPLTFTSDAEVGGTGYVRQPISWSMASNSGIITNTNALIFTGVNSGETVCGVGVFTSDSSREVGFYGLFDTPRLIALSSDSAMLRKGVGSLTIAPGSLAFRIG